MKVSTIMFHDVVTPEFAAVRKAEAESGVYAHPMAAFDRYLEAMEDTGLPVRTVHDLAPNDDLQVMITVDDGGNSNLYMADRLEAKGWPGHFFIITRGMHMKGYATPEEIQELHARGHVVGTHTHSHPLPFSKQPYDKMLIEWSDSAKQLSDLIGAPVVDGSVPGGSLNRNIFRSAAEAGLARLFTSDPILEPWKQDGLQCFGRMCPKRNTTPDTFAAHTRGEGWARALRITRLKRFIKRSLLRE